MNRKQIFCIFTGAVLFGAAGAFLQAERIGVNPEAWPGAGDVAICLSIILMLTVGVVFAFKELTQRHDVMLVVVTMILGVCGGLGCWFYHNAMNPKYTAEAVIKILPYALKDPMSFTRPDVDKDMYYQFRVGKAGFMRQQSLLQQLLKRDKVRQTEWYKRFDHDVADAVSDLTANLSVEIKRDSNLMTVSMACDSAKDSAIIVNELVDLFIKSHHDMATSGIRAQLAERTKQKHLIRAQMLQTEDSLDTIRKGTSFVIEDAQYSHLLAATLIEIETEYGKLERKLSLLEAKLVLLKSTPAGSADGAEQKHSANVKETEDHLTAITKQLETVQRQRIQARGEYKELDNLRASYEKIKVIRDEKRSLLKDITVNIERLNMLFNDPEVSKVKRLGRTSEPLEADVQGVGRFVLSGIIGGFICGVWLGLMRGNAGV